MQSSEEFGSTAPSVVASTLEDILTASIRVRVNMFSDLIDR